MQSFAVLPTNACKSTKTVSFKVVKVLEQNYCSTTCYVDMYVFNGRLVVSATSKNSTDQCLNTKKKHSNISDT